MSTDLGRIIVKDFLESSKLSIETLLGELHKFKGNNDKQVHFLHVKNGHIEKIIFTGEHFFLRSSVEYSNPQLTVEEVQGIIAARLLEVCGNYFENYTLTSIDSKDFNEVCELLNKPPHGKVVSYLLNTDDVEPDRYSMNPLKTSIMESGQSAFPSAYVQTENLELDENFMKKYEGSLISKFEADLITRHIGSNKSSYMNMVDLVKYDHLGLLSKSFGIDLNLPLMRMPITVLDKEKPSDLLHYIISESHKDYAAVERVYNCMGRSMKNKTTLLTIPHSKKGFGSKRAARGKLYFEGEKLKSVQVTYKTTLLYPNAIDPNDVSIAKAEDQFMVDSSLLTNYDFDKTPSSPQFILYSLTSPEDAVVWHGIGEFGASQLVKSYTQTHLVCADNALIANLNTKYKLITKIPPQFNLIPGSMWVHPIHRNIDASIGCVENLMDLAKMGLKLDPLSIPEYTRT